MSTTDRPIRVMYFARAPFISGAERALLSMVRHLDRSRVDPMVVLGHPTAMVDRLREIGVPATVIAMPKRSLASLMSWCGSLRRLRRAIGEFKPDVLHANDVPSCQAMSVLGGELGLPRVIHVRWTITAADAAWWARGGAESVLCISRWVRDQLGNTGGTVLRNADVEVLFDCVDWPAKASRETDRFQAGAESSHAVGFAGQLIPSKGLDMVIRGMAQVPAGQRPMFLIAGEDKQTGGAYQRQLAARAEQLGVAGSIRWLGFLSDPRKLYGQVAAMACPSLEEPLGLVPLEAAEFSLPTIANRVGGLAETVVDGETGWLVDPTPEAWAKALSRLSERETLRRLGAAANQRTIEHFSPMVYQQRLMALYQRLVAKR